MLVLRAREVHNATPRTRIIRIDLGNRHFAFSAGQAVVVGVRGGVLHKPYSIACSPARAAASGMLELLVQTDDADPENPHLEQVAPGTALDVAGPFGTFVLPTPVVDSHLLFVGGGTGIAPLRAMIQSVLDQQLSTRVTLIYSVRAAEELAFGDELRRLADTGMAEVYFTVSRIAAPSWQGLQGRVSRDLLVRAMADRAPRSFICGPPGFVATATNLLREAGLGDHLIVSESY